jgi:GAF domain
MGIVARPPDFRSEGVGPSHPATEMETIGVDRLSSVEISGGCGARVSTSVVRRARNERGGLLSFAQMLLVYASRVFIIPQSNELRMLQPVSIGSVAPNERIRLTVGLCGLAATSEQVVVVQDVSKDPRYLAGSPMVKSEIVVPIFVGKKLAAELDIES